MRASVGSYRRQLGPICFGVVGRPKHRRACLRASCRRTTRASSWASLRLTRRTLGSAKRHVARATRAAKLRPGGVVPAEVGLACTPEDIEELPRLYVTRMPKVKGWLP
jgi:hypothetical protein